MILHANTFVCHTKMNTETNLFDLEINLQFVFTVSAAHLIQWVCMFNDNCSMELSSVSSKYIKRQCAILFAKEVI